MGCTASAAAVPHQNNNNNRPSNSNSNRSASWSQQPVPSLASLPLVPAKPYRHGAHITMGELNNQRNEFWATRTEGNAQMWQSIRSAAEAMLVYDIGLANAILEASGLITPNGSLEVCYDERGAQYKVPQYCYANPLELSTEPVPAAANNTSSNVGGPAVEIMSTESVRSNKSNNNPTGLHDSGATTNSAGSSANNGPVAKLRVRINPGDHNLNIVVDLGGTVQTLKQVLVREVEEKIPSIRSMSIQRQRIIFMGKELTNSLKIKDCKFDDSKVVQVFLRPV